ncbi:MAG: hypothetical protein ACI4WW_06075 [Candidatus Coprovivens sp.]
MNKKFNEFREKYPNFIYKSYNIEIIEDNLKLTFNFEIPNLASFNPTTIIPLNNHKIEINNTFFKYLVFNLGLVELISYYKCTCSPNIIIEADYIDENQINWFKKLYYYGLGEFLYLNDIEIDQEKLVNIKCTAIKNTIASIDYNGQGNLIPIGGGKDSTVSLEILKKFKEDNHCFIINPKPVTLDCAKVAGYTKDKIISIKRNIDKKLIELNNQGFLNGHTPFSAMVAFTSYITAFIYNKKYITLSNEASANESTVIGTKINHQYSKTYEFENDFNNYTKKYFGINISYFSLLRPLTEYQIAMLFSNYKKYHQIFKSCNVGSKNEEWKWCCNCAKCLFVFTILSTYLYKDELVNIFGEDMFDNKSLENIFKELLGYSETKPFECVGTYEEVRYATSLTIKKLEGQKLPYLLQFYKDNYPLETNHNFENSYNNLHNLPKEYEELVRKELDKYAK